MKNIQLDVNYLKVSPNGVEDFVWPLKRQEVCDMRDQLYLELAFAIQTLQVQNTNDSRWLRIVFSYLVIEAMALFQAHALNRRYSELGRKPNPMASGKIIPTLYSGSMLEKSVFLESLTNGNHLQIDRPWIPVRFRKIWRQRWSYRWNSSSITNLWRCMSPAEAEAITISPLIDIHARSTRQIVKYVSLGDWYKFGTPTAEEIKKHALSMTASDMVIQAIAKAFHAGNEEISTAIEKYIRMWLELSTGAANWHFNSQLNQARKLPTSLWTGAGGPFWVRILRHVVRESGGKVVGHDHGIGSGHLVSSAFTLLELESSDIFVTSTKGQAQALRAGVQPDLQLNSILPKIVAVPQSIKNGRMRKTRKMFSAESRRSSVKKIMYASTFYNGERMHGTPQIPDMVAVDWEARLFNKLIGWGLDVLHKPHPGSVATPPVEFVQLGVKLNLKPLETIIDEVDVLVVTSSQSTSFANALASQKPIVYVDFGLVQWTDEAYEMVGRRCQIVKGWFDIDNRAQVDWNELRLGINESLHLNNSDFVNHYLAYWGSPN